MKRSTGVSLTPSTLTSLALALAVSSGCTRSSAAPSPPGGDPAEGRDGDPAGPEQVERAALPGSITVVPPLLPPDPQTWRFDPEGRFVAALLDRRCGLWGVDDGHFGGFVEGGADAEPCVSWRQIQRYEDWEVRGPIRGTIHASFDDTSLRVEDEEAKELRLEERCVGCRWVSAALDAKAQRVAAAWIGDDRQLGIRVFALDDGRELASLPLKAAREVDEARELRDVDLVWGERLIAMLEVDPWACLPEARGADPSCEEALPFTVGVWAWTDLAAPPEFEPFYEDESNLREATFLDPDEEFLWLVVGQDDPREGVSWYLDPLALGERRTQLSWSRSEGDDYDSYIDPESGGQWLPGPQVSWGDAVVGWGMGDWWMNWTVVEVRPSPAVWAGYVWKSGLPEGPSWAFYGGSGDPEHPDETWAAFDFHGCFEARSEEEMEELTQMYGLEDPCMRHGTTPEGCETLAASASHRVALLRCTSGLSRAVFDEEGEVEAEELLTRGRTFEWLWAPAGLLVLGDRAGLELWSVDGEERRALEPGLAATVRRIHEPALAKDLGLALLELEPDEADPRGLAVLELDSGKLRARLELEGALVHAAFSPDAKLLAVSDGRTITMFELDRPDQPLVRWSPGKVAGLAFRQDGAVLWSGGQRPLPEHAWDPRTGEARDDQRPPKELVERLAAGQLAPSWRWSAQPDGWIVRSLDGRALLPTSEAALLDSGLIAGNPDRLEANLRVGPNPGDPVFEAEELFALLEYPTLLADFFAGVRFPTPTLSEAEVAAALAERPEPEKEWRRW